MHSHITTQRISRSLRRRGNILVLAASVLVMVFAFTAFTVDVGYITLTKAEIQKTADASALAGAIELMEAYGPGSNLTSDQVAAVTRAASVDTAAANVAGGEESVYLDGARDVRLGKYEWDAASGTWQKSWGVAPYNLIEVTVHRDQSGSGNGDGPLDLFFAPVIGTKQANVSAVATTALKPGVGFRKIPGQNISILPIALDEPTWDALIEHGVGTDNYSYNLSTGAITSGGDGIKEVSLYPSGEQLMPPGNRGTVDFGSTNNSTADISRQIRYGLNDSDWAALQAQGISELRWDTEPLYINGDTGLSAGIKDDLNSIKGKPRAIPLFTEVSGPGNNAMYTIVRFVGIRIMFVQLTGKPSSKMVVIQPAPFSADAVIEGEVQLTNDTIFGPASLVP